MLENINSNKEKLLIGAILGLFITIEFGIVSLFQNSIVLIVLMNIGFSVILFISISIKNLRIALIIFNLVPLLFFNIPFHYVLKTVLLQDVPLMILGLMFLVSSLSNKEVFTLRFNYLELPFIFYTLYIFFVVLYGFYNNHNLIAIMDELWHSLYYVFFFVFTYILRNKRDYKIIIFFLMGLSALISVELIFFSIGKNVERFVIFQSYILPIFLSLAFSCLLFRQNTSTQKILLNTFIALIASGIIITLTRTVWVSSLISISILVILYLVRIRNFSYKQIIIIVMILSLPLIFLSSSIFKSSAKEPENLNDIEYRTQSVANPTQDVSFLMRVELTIYIVREFLTSPIIGKGFADSVEYKILGIKDVPIYYPDNSWIFFLWKGGIIGLFLFAWIYYRVLRTSLYIARNTNDFFVKSTMLGIFAGIIGVMFLGIFNAVLIKYKTTIILPLLFSYINYEYENLLENSSESGENY